MVSTSGGNARTETITAAPARVDGTIIVQSVSKDAGKAPKLGTRQTVNSDRTLEWRK